MEHRKESFRNFQKFKALLLRSYAQVAKFEMNEHFPGIRKLRILNLQYYTNACGFKGFMVLQRKVASHKNDKRN